MKKSPTVRSLFLLTFVFLGLTVGPGWAKSSRLVILHTNDIHDHVRAGDEGIGGLPYVSGYVQQVRAAEPAVLLVDAGDVTEKGDLVAFKTHGVMTFEAMSRVGYDAVTIGNHDFDEVTLDQVHHYSEVLGQPMLNLNIVKADGTPEFTPSRIVERGGIKIGLIGMIVPRKPHRGGLNVEESGRALAHESQRLRDAGAELLVAVCHESVKDCAQWSLMAPLVQVFVSGHSHEQQLEPLVVPATGALVVQAGSYARWVGRLEIDFDQTTQTITHFDGSLVPMLHDTIPVDADMLAWVQTRELELAPEAAEFIFNNPAEIDGFSIARLGAEALRRAAHADVGFCHPYQVIRAILPAGPVDVNMVFKTGGHRGHDCVLTNLTGAEIESYANALFTIQQEPPEWAGFHLTAVKPADARKPYRSDLDAQKSYRVVMPLLEWETRYQKLAKKVAAIDPADPLATRKVKPESTPVNFTDAMRAYLAQIIADGETVQARADELAKSRLD